MLAPLDNETIFKRAFTDIEVFQLFVKDLFDIDIKVDKIETEKQFKPPIAGVNIKLDIYAESTDHRFVVEIQKIDYDYNFNRFLNYFISLLIEQQLSGSKYEIPQTVLGVIVLTSPYKIDQLTGEPIKESVMSIDFDPRNLKDKRIHLWKHKLLFLNPNPKYKDDETPANFQDWLNLFNASVNDRTNYKLNLKNKGVVRTIGLIEYENLDPETRRLMKISESRKAMISIERKEGREEERIKQEQLRKKERIKQEQLRKKERKEQEEKQHKEKLAMAKLMLKDGEPIDKIMKYTGLSKDEIEKLLKK